MNMSEPCLCQEPELEFYNFTIDENLLPHWILARANCSECGADEKIAIALDDHWEWLNNLDN
jgi:hypothetical protein